MIGKPLVRVVDGAVYIGFEEVAGSLRLYPLAAARKSVRDLQNAVLEGERIAGERAAAVGPAPWPMSGLPRKGASE